MSSEKKTQDVAIPEVVVSPHESSSNATANAEAGSADLLGLGSDEDVPPPAYGSVYGQIEDGETGSGTGADVTDDGRVNVRINQQTRGLSSLLVPALRSQLDLLATQSSGPYIPPGLEITPGKQPPPPLNIVIQVVGSRGDVQPFVALGKVLKEVHKHRVRLATHTVFKSFVEENGLEFFDISGDPAELMAFMVKNPGLMPGFDSLRSGDIGHRRREIGIMIRRCWRSCIETGDGSGVEASNQTIAEPGEYLGNDNTRRPFVADAIIANPPSFAHIHCAEKLGVPLHMMFTMPWSPTQSFPHPLANIQSTNADASMTNFITYGLVDMMTWQGLGDVINRFRQKSLGLEPISLTWAPGMLARLRVPYTYCWSPALIPKPRDWGSYISISGFYFLNLASNYTPDSDLVAFLEAGPPPIYIGFGSIVVDDPNAMTKMIFDAVQLTGKRALVSKGWGGFGADQIGIPEGVYMLGNVPHDWLFKHVSAVVHHGGAGTTAAGISSGKPTVVVPFFGDQPFWGAMIAKAGAGPQPVPYKQLNAEKLAASIMEALEPSTVTKAQELADKIKLEKGTEVGANSFHQELDTDKLRCTLCPKRVAVWRIKRTEVKLSAFAATVLCNQKHIKYTDLKLYRSLEHFTEDQPFDPISGGASALVGTLGSMAMGIADMPVAALKALKIHPDAKRSKSPGSGASSRSRSRSETARTEADSPESARRDSSNDVTVTPEVANIIEHQGVQDSLASPSSTAESSSERRPSLRSSFSLEESNAKINTKPAAVVTEPYSMDDAVKTGSGVLRIASAGIKSPLDFTLGLARGFHNAPKLYGDDSVRELDKITDFQSGLKVAGKEFGLGMYDGISGLVTQPLRGAKTEGAAGFFKGVGKGIGGIVLKPGAAFWGIPGYTAQGMYKELHKRFGPNVDNYIIASRTAQGYEDMRTASAQEVEAVVRNWKEIKPYIRKKKTFGEVQMESVKEAKSRLDEGGLSKMKSKTAKSRDRTPEPKNTDSPTKHGLERSDTTKTDDSGVWSPIDSNSRTSTMEFGQTSAKAPERSQEDIDFEEAIQRSVQETSHGNEEEDAMIEKAIRASVAELRAAQRRVANESELKATMQRSIEEATMGVSDHQSNDANSGFVTDEDTEVGNGENEDLKRALKESHDSYKGKEREEEEARKEEEIIMKYMLKQSLAEENMRQERLGS